METREEYKKRLIKTITDVSNRIDAAHSGANWVVLSPQLAPVFEDTFDSTFQEDYNIRAVENRVKKSIEFDRILYLKEVQKLTGYKINSFSDLRNCDEE